MAKHGKYEQRRTSGKGRKTGKILLTVLAVLLTAAVAGGVLLYNSTLNLINRAEISDNTNVTVDPALLGNFEETEATEPETTEAPSVTETTVPETEHIPSPEDVINVLVVGQAYRDGEESHLADTMILVSANKYTKEVTLTSFLRDAYVDMPDYKGKQCGWNRINLVYHLGYTWGGNGGAMEMMNMCLKNNFGIEVDYNVEIDFEAFPKVIDVLGGVRINLTEAEAKYINEEPGNWQEVTPGENRLFGDAALSYARMRKAEGDGDSDIKRTARQRTMVTALLEKLRYRGVEGIMDLSKEILPLITTNMTNAQITECMLEFLPILPDMTIKTGTCPVETSYWGELIEIGGYPASVLKFYPDQQKRLMMPITEGYTP